MRRATGPVCIVLQTAPKTTPRPTPREASRIKERRTQLAPADGDGVCFQRRGGGVAFGRVCVVRASAPRRSNVQAGGVAEPQHFGSACVRAASAPRQQQQMQAGARGAFLAAARRRTPVFVCALARRLRKGLGMTNQPWLQRETGQTRPAESRRNPFFHPRSNRNPELRDLVNI